ncbi:MAG: PQQ-binding-like beta-propeller repeat protein [Pirellulales bacterium]
MKFSLSNIYRNHCKLLLIAGIVFSLSVSSLATAQEKLPPNLSTRKQGTDWPTFLGPNRNGKSSETGLSSPWPQSGPKVLWHKQLGTSYGICSISRGRVFQFDRHENVERLTVLNAETGDFLWKFEYLTQYEDSLGYNNGPRTSPVIDGDRVYIYGAEGKLHCLSIASRKLLWNIDVNKRFGVVQNFFGVGSTPVIYEDLLLVMVGGSPKESHGFGRFDLDRVVGNGSGIVAFDKLTGEIKYQFSDEMASYAGMTWQKVGDRDFGFAFVRGGLVAFNPKTGKQDFHYPWRSRVRDSVNASTPIVSGDEVFISETYGPGSSLLKVKPGEYEVVWKDNDLVREKKMQTHWNTCILHNGYLYGSSGRHTSNAELRCIEWKTGKVMWSEPALSRSSLMYADGHLVCLSEDGVLRLLKATPDRFELVSEVYLRIPQQQSNVVSPAMLKYPAWAAPILSHGLLYLRGEDRMVCLEVIPQGQ